MTSNRINRLKQFSLSLASNYDRKQTLRIASLAFLFLAMFGPWVYDKINVPAEYPCRFPNVRLEGDFCGVPLSGGTILFMFLGGLNSIITQSMTGIAVFPDRARELLFMLSFILLPLPSFSTLLVLFKRNTHGLLIFNLGMWGLGAALGAFWFAWLLSYPYAHKWRLWGFWSYLVAAIGMLLLESLVLRMKRKRTLIGS
jgi:hypothetical protein